MTATLDIGALYEEHGAFLGRTIERLVGPGPHVDDILQETFVTAFQKLGAFDPSRAAVSTWLYGIAANSCRHHRRSQWRFWRLKDRFEVLRPKEREPVTPEQQLEQARSVAELQQILAAMPFALREVFVLYEVEELDGVLIANTLDVPVNTVWSRLRKARELFAKLAGKRREREVPS